MLRKSDKFGNDKQPAKNPAVPKGKAKPPKGKAKAAEKSVFRIGIYGHKGVGKTVFFTALYSYLKKSSDIQILALGPTQAILEENTNLMRGIIKAPRRDHKLSKRLFPDFTSTELKLSFSIKSSNNFDTSLETIDYPGDYVHLDSKSKINQNLLEFFNKCDCILFLIDPETINNRNIAVKRIASFTHLIKQLSLSRKNFNIPIGLVITKADELPGFKSENQSILIAKGKGYFRAFNFADFKKQILNQQSVKNNQLWQKDLEAIFNRLQPFFSPLMKRTKDFQIFFSTSTGSSPEIISVDTGKDLKIPPDDFRPIGISQPLIWAIRRIKNYKKAAVYKTILKFTALIVLVAALFYIDGQAYHKKRIDKLFAEINAVNMGASDANKDIARAFKSYSNNIIVKYFFKEFSLKAEKKYLYFMDIGNNTE